MENVTYSNELCHYGVKGMKWGVRRYRNEDGSLTSAGKKRARQEYKEDNKMAFELGKNATLYGHAAARSLKRTINIENKLDKQYAKDQRGSKHRTQSLKKKWDASSKASMQLVDMYNRTKDAAEKHCNSLIEKYGKEAVSNIQYVDKKLPKGEYSPETFRTMNESTTKLSEYAIAGATNVASALAMIGGAPIGIFTAPKSTSQKAADLEYRYYRSNR